MKNRVRQTGRIPKPLESTPERPGAVAKPMTVTTTQKPTTINLCRSTHRVNFSTRHPP